MEVIRNFPDSEIVSNLRFGKDIEPTIKAIYRDHFENLSWWVMNNSGSRQDAEDIFQEVIVNFIDLVQKDRFRAESTIKTFLFSLNRFTWLNELKKRGRALAREEKYERVQDRVVEDVSSLMAGRESRLELNQLMDKLGDTCKKVLLMFYYEGRSMKEIHELLHYESEQAVRNKKYKCMKQMEQLVNEDPVLKQNLKNLLHG